MTHHKGDSRSNQKDRGGGRGAVTSNSNRKHLMSKHFKEMEYIHQQAAAIHTDDEIYINKPSSAYQ